MMSSARNYSNKVLLASLCADKGAVRDRSKLEE